MTSLVPFFPSLHLLTAFWLFFFRFSSPPSEQVLLRLAHQPLHLSIFCHGEKHLNLSLHLFITCHLHFLLHPLSFSPPLHLCICVLNNLYIRQTPPASALYVLYNRHSPGFFSFFFKHLMNANFENRPLLWFLIQLSNYWPCETHHVFTKQGVSSEKILQTGLQLPGWPVVCFKFFQNSLCCTWPVIESTTYGSHISANGIDIHGTGS